MDTPHQQPEHRRGIARPTAHVLALAPLDVWARMLIRSGGVRPRYWLRLGFILFTSFVGTICTVHERLVLNIVRRLKFGRDPRIEHEPGAVVILGYYRSGTTHLHNLMSCDDRLITPRWYQALAGQGFWIGWALIRFILVPFLGSSRPQDSVGFGPDWPAEDDFAMSSWGMCSSIPGRFIWPSQWDDWKRWHGLDGLSDMELHRWRSLMAMFIWKLTRGRNKARIILLKTPSHTARVAELDRLFKGNVKFIHLVREPTAVIESNVRLHDSLKAHLLEDEPDVQAVRDRIVDEYAYTLGKCDRESQGIESERFIRVRYQDLRADGMGTLEHIYQTLGLKWDDHTQSSARKYLGSLGEYSSKKETIDLGRPTEHEEKIKAEIIARYGLGEPTIEQVAIEPTPPIQARIVRGYFASALMAIGFGMVWVSSVSMIHMMDDGIRVRLIPLVWVCGALIGLTTRRAARIGTRSLGIWAAALTVLVVLGVAFPVTVINWNWASNGTTQQWLYHNAKGGYEGLRSVASIAFIVLGAVTAYRHASASGPTAPGKATAKSAKVLT